MDGREGMSLSGSAAPYYFHNRGLSGGGGVSGVATTHTAFGSPTGFINLTNPNLIAQQFQSNFRASTSPFNVESSPVGFSSPNIFSIPMPSSSAPGGSGGADTGSLVAVGGGGSEPLPVRKKRGRPRKYAPVPDGSSGGGGVLLGLSQLSSSPNSNTEKKKRGRPPGSGRKQRLASVGEWMSNSAGLAFTPHVIYVAQGEDIASKVLSFSQQRPRALCIMSASGGVSSVTLHHPEPSVGNLTYEAHFEILCLSGSYLVAETGGARNRTGGVNVSLASPDGQVIGGSVAGGLIASRPSQVVVCSFVYGNQKPDTPKIKTKTESDSKDDKNSSVQNTSDNTNMALVNASPSRQMSLANIEWSDSRAFDGRNPKADIDLMR